MTPFGKICGELGLALKYIFYGGAAIIRPNVLGDLGGGHLASAFFIGKLLFRGLNRVRGCHSCCCPLKFARVPSLPSGLGAPVLSWVGGGHWCFFDSFPVVDTLTLVFMGLSWFS